MNVFRTAIMKNILTVDLEDWCQGNTRIGMAEAAQYESRIERSMDRLLGVLDEYGTRATFFALGHLAESFPHLIKKAHDLGHEIATHGYSHELIYRQTPERFRAELLRSVAICEDITGSRLLGHRASNWSITRRSLWALDIAREAGLVYDSSVYPTRTHVFGISGWPRWMIRLPHGLMEIPPSTLKIAGRIIPFSGGFFLRMLPEAIIMWAVRRINAEGHPAVICLHPWELDVDQPKNLPLPWPDRFIHYTNLVTTERKLRNLCSTIDFHPVREVISL
jgi:polysaccharide deacetylase family protein (PEP-CTERM system associated)